MRLPRTCHNCTAVWRQMRNAGVAPGVEQVNVQVHGVRQGRAPSPLEAAVSRLAWMRGSSVGLRMPRTWYVTSTPRTRVPCPAVDAAGPLACWDAVLLLLPDAPPEEGARPELWPNCSAQLPRPTPVCSPLRSCRPASAATPPAPRPPALSLAAAAPAPACCDSICRLLCTGACAGDGGLGG